MALSDFEKEVQDFLRPMISEKRLERIEEVLSHRTRHLCLVLEDIFHNHNASATIRTADCFGVQDVHIIQKYNEFTPSTKVVKGSARWVSRQVYSGDKNPSEKCIRQLKKQGYQIVATTPAGGIAPSELSAEKPLAVMFGAEKQGLSNYMLEQADHTVRIPMYGFTESLNISVSVALLFYELRSKVNRLQTFPGLSEGEKDELRLDWMKKSVNADVEAIIRAHFNRK